MLSFPSSWMLMDMHERHMWGHAILFSYKTMTTMHYNRSYGRCLGFQHGLKIRFQTIFDSL